MTVMHWDASYLQTITHLRHLESFHTNHSFRLLPLKRMKVDGRVAADTSIVCIPFLWKSISYRHASTQAPILSLVCLRSFLSPCAVCLCHILYLLFILLFILSFCPPCNVFCQFWSFHPRNFYFTNNSFRHIHVVGY
jgi:hypothetical protein